MDKNKVTVFNGLGSFKDATTIHIEGKKPEDITAKNTIIQNIRKTTLDESVTTADQLREKILSNLLDGQSASTVALSYLKNEVAEVLG